MPQNKMPESPKTQTQEAGNKYEADPDSSFRRPVLVYSSESGLLPGLILVMIGVLFLLSTYGLLGGEWWQYFLVALGVVFLIEAWIQYINPATRRPRIGRTIAGLVLITVGLIFLFDASQWWPLILIVIGIILIVQYFVKTDLPPKK
jgi:chromate transport protein ChrA